MLYGAECWTVKNQHKNKICVAKMRMVRWMCGKTKCDRIRTNARWDNTYSGKDGGNKT